VHPTRRNRWYQTLSPLAPPHHRTLGCPPPPARLPSLPSGDPSVLAQFQDKIWYPATIQGDTATDHTVIFKGYEHEAEYALTHVQIQRPSQGQDACSAENPTPVLEDTEKYMCEIHNKPRTGGNLMQTLDQNTRAMIWRCKPTHLYRNIDEPGNLALDTPPTSNSYDASPQTHSRSALTFDREAGKEGLKSRSSDTTINQPLHHTHTSAPVNLK
jgi:hypothetical protein